MITEDISIYEDELAAIDGQLAKQNAGMPIEFFKAHYPLWDRISRDFYAQQLHVSVAELHSRLDVQQSKCSCCGRKFRFEDGFRTPVLCRRNPRESFVYSNVLLRCSKCSSTGDWSVKDGVHLMPDFDCSADKEV